MYEEEVFFEVLKKIIDQQLTDIEKSFKAGVDLLCLVGCMNLFEFLGGIRNGTLGQRYGARDRFNSGIDLVRDNLPEFDLWVLRNALTHQYIPKIDRFPWIMIRHSKNTRLFLETEDTTVNILSLVRLAQQDVLPLIVAVESIIQMVKSANDELMKELGEDEGMRTTANRILFSLPKQWTG